MVDRLRKRRDFLAAAKAHRAGVASMGLQGRDRGDDGEIRVGFTVTKKTGNAVIRNRIRRRLRAAVGEVLPAAGRAGHDYVLIARTEALRLPFRDLVGDLGRALRKLHDPRPKGSHARPPRDPGAQPQGRGDGKGGGKGGRGRGKRGGPQMAGAPETARRPGMPEAGDAPADTTISTTVISAAVSATEAAATEAMSNGATPARAMPFDPAAVPAHHTGAAPLRTAASSEDLRLTPARGDAPTPQRHAPQPGDHGRLPRRSACHADGATQE